MCSVMYLSSGRPPNREEQVPLVEVELTHAARQTKECTLAFCTLHIPHLLPVHSARTSVLAVV